MSDQRQQDEDQPETPEARPAPEGAEPTTDERTAYNVEDEELA